MNGSGKLLKATLFLCIVIVLATTLAISISANSKSDRGLRANIENIVNTEGDSVALLKNIDKFVSQSVYRDVRDKLEESEVKIDVSDKVARALEASNKDKEYNADADLEKLDFRILTDSSGGYYVDAKDIDLRYPYKDIKLKAYNSYVDIKLSEVVAKIGMGTKFKCIGVSKISMNNYCLKMSNGIESVYIEVGVDMYGVINKISTGALVYCIIN